MTESQRKMVSALRQNGMGYKTIASRTGISVNTVKSFCRRKKAKTEGGKADAGMHYCLCCGVPVEQHPGRKEKKFCSNACRMRWWSAHPEMGQKGVRLVCPVCGTTFISHRNAHRKYCSHKCYIEDRFGGGQHEQG